MQAATFSRFGAPDVLTLTELPQPTVGDDQVLVAVHASAVTQGDRRLRAADFPGISAIIGRLMFGFRAPRNPTPGTMFAGRVVAVGSAVTGFAVGEDVFGGADHSACAEFIVVKEDSPLAHMPAGLSYTEAAALPYGAGTAIALLVETAKLEAGERILIIGASGGVGRYAVQLAAHLGAEVTGVCSGRHADLVRELGATEVIDYNKQDWWTTDQTWDLVFDTTSGAGFHNARPRLSPEGRYVTVYMDLQVIFQMLMTKVLGGPRVMSGVALGEQARTEEVARLMEAGALEPTVAACFPLAEVVAAHAALEGPSLGGEVVVTMDHGLTVLEAGPVRVSA